MEVTEEVGEGVDHSAIPMSTQWDIMVMSAQTLALSGNSSILAKAKLLELISIRSVILSLLLI